MSHPLIHELVTAQARARPDALAVSAPDAQLRYDELERRSNQLAHLLWASGVGVETRVGLCLERSAALVVGALGILKAGGAYVALDPSAPAQRRDFMLRDSGAAAVVASPSLAARTGAAAETVVALDSKWAALGGQRTGAVDAGVSSGNLAYLIYTSGSTGTPKGVMLEHRGLSNLVSWHRQAFSVGPGDRCTQIASPGFDACVWELWPALAAGASIHVPPDAVRGRPEALRDWLVAERITVSFVPTPLAEAVMALDWPADVALRCLLTGGDVLHRHPAPTLPFALFNNYGPAETTVVATSGRVPPAGEGPAADGTTAPSIGTPIASVTVHIVGDSLQPVADGEVGELLIGGAGVARGYLNRPELTAERFVPDPFSTEGGRLYRTGDLVRSRRDGELEFVGRADEQVQIRGQRIELGEIAATLDRHPAVRRSVVIVAGEGSGQKRLVACAVPSDGAHPDVETLRSSLATTLPDYMLPADVVWLTELPMTASDKVDRPALAALIASGASRAAGSRAAPRNDLEEALVAIVAELLGLDTAGIDENFFLLGGHSLMGAQMIARIEQRFGVELPLRDLFEKPTVAEIAQEVERLLVADLEAMSDNEAETLTLVSQASGAGH